MSGPVENLDGLCHRVSKAKIIPAMYIHLGWDCMQKSDELVYYKLDMAGVSV